MWGLSRRRGVGVVFESVNPSLVSATHDFGYPEGNSLHSRHSRDAVKEPDLSIPWTRMRLGMVLHRKNIEIRMFESLDCAVVRVDLRNLNTGSLN